MGIITLVMHICMYISIYLFIPLLLAIRIYLALKHKTDLKTSLFIIFLPFSFGYYYCLDKSKRIKVYNLVLIVFLIITVVGFGFTIFQRFVPSLDAFL